MNELRPCQQSKMGKNCCFGIVYCVSINTSRTLTRIHPPFPCNQRHRLIKSVRLYHVMSPSKSHAAMCLKIGAYFYKKTKQLLQRDKVYFKMGLEVVAKGTGCKNKSGLYRSQDWTPRTPALTRIPRLCRSLASAVRIILREERKK